MTAVPNHQVPLLHVFNYLSWQERAGLALVCKVIPGRLHLHAGIRVSQLR